MLIVLEGPDCAGKTTFANRIAERIKRAEPSSQVSVWHSDVPQNHPLDEYVGVLTDYRPGTDRHDVCDRWHVGETVYPQLLDRPTQQTRAVRAYVELFLQSRGALLVHCQATPAHLRACGVARGDDRADVARIDRAVRLFEAAITSTTLPWLSVNVSDPDRSDYHDVVDQVIALANDEDWYTEHLNRFTTYVGAARPRLLLLGDRRGPAATDVADYGSLPAFMPYPGTSGLYLLETLTSKLLTVPTHGLLLGQVGIANACDVDDPRELWDALGRPEVVALGANAHRKLRELRVPYRRVPHPQWARRFKHHDRAGYLDALLQPARVTT